jgi:hypothetical protein
MYRVGSEAVKQSAIDFSSGDNAIPACEPLCGPVSDAAPLPRGISHTAAAELEPSPVAALSASDRQSFEASLIELMSWGHYGR